MSIISDFKEFKEFKNKNTYYTDKLYYADLVRYEMSSEPISLTRVTVCTDYKPIKPVIVQEISVLEAKKYLKNQFGGDTHKLPKYQGYSFTSVRYFKIPSLGGRIVPFLNANQAKKVHTGIVDCIEDVMPLSSVIKDLPETMNVEQIKKVESGMWNTIENMRQAGEVQK